MNKVESFSLAEKMFKKLGYEKYETSLGEVAYTLQEYYYKTVIVFSLSGYQVEMFHYVFEDDEAVLSSVVLDKKEIFAIQQQMKEMGWLDE